MPVWMKHKPKSRWRNINNLRYADDNTLMVTSLGRSFCTTNQNNLNHSILSIKNV